MSFDLRNDWVFLTGDVNWEDYGGKWGKKAPEGWYILEFINMYGSAGKKSCQADGVPEFRCEVDLVFVPELLSEEIAQVSMETIDDALSSYGFRLDLSEEEPKIYADSNVFAAGSDEVERVIAEALHNYGCSAPLAYFVSANNPLKLLAKGKRYAEKLMSEPESLEKLLDKPANKIGTTAREFAQGNSLAGLERGPFDAIKQLMRKVSGLPPGEEK